MGEDTRAIEGQIEDTRERMGDTVAALSYKADVPGRMKDSVSEKKDAVTGKLSSAKDASWVRRETLQAGLRTAPSG